MKEIECKILEINKEKIEKKLIELGAKKILDSIIHARILDFEDDKLKEKHDLLRLRNEGGKNILCFKERLANKEVKISNEYEIEVLNIDRILKILESIGITIKLEAKKHRISYILNDVRFEIDKPLENLSHIPTYLEIEAKDLETIHKYAKILNFKKEDCLSWGFTKLKNHYRKV